MYLGLYCMISLIIWISYVVLLNNTKMKKILQICVIIFEGVIGPIVITYFSMLFIKEKEHGLDHMKLQAFIIYRSFFIQKCYKNVYLRMYFFVVPFIIFNIVNQIILDSDNIYNISFTWI